MPTLRNRSRIGGAELDSAGIGKLLPALSNELRCRARIRARRIAWTCPSFRFAKVGAGTHSHEGHVDSPWCGGCCGWVAFTRGAQGEGLPGVNLDERLPRNVDSPRHVDEADPVVVDEHHGSPQHDPIKIANDNRAKKGEDARALESSHNCNCGNCAQQPDEDRSQHVESRSEDFDVSWTLQIRFGNRVEHFSILAFLEAHSD